MSKNTVLSEVNGSVLTVTFNRPQARNAADLDTFIEFDKALVVAEDDSIRCVIIRGAAGHFMAGGDLRMFAKVPETPMDERHEAISKVVDIAHAPLRRLRALAKPVVAIAEGGVAGYGLSVLNNCDLAIASDTSFYSVAYTAIGTSPDGGGSFALSRLIGVKKAMQLALMNDRLTAQEALDIGFVNYVVPEAGLKQAADKLVQHLANGPTLAYAKAKHLLWSGQDRDFDGQLEAEKDAFANSTMTEDFVEGVMSFITKKKPEFKGK